MDVIRIMSNLPVADIEAAKTFYTHYFGLTNEDFNMGWVARYTSPDLATRVQLVHAMPPRPRTRSRRSTPPTSKRPMPKRSNSATRSCIR